MSLNRDLSLFSSVAGRRRSRTEQGQGSRESVGGTECCVSPEIHLWWQPCGQGYCHGAGSNCRSATSQGDVCAQCHGRAAGLFCRIPYLPSLSSRDVLMMNQPVNVKEHNQHGLDIGLHLPHFLRSSRWCCVPLGGHMLCFWVIPLNPAFITSDYRGHEVGIILGLLMEVSANWHAIVLLLRRHETGHKFHWHTSHLQFFSWNFLACTECYSNILCNLSDSQHGWFLAHVSRSPQCGRWTACLGGGRFQRIGIHFWNGNTT